MEMNNNRMASRSSSTRKGETMITDEEAVERRVRREMYDRAVDSIARRLRMVEVYGAMGVLGNRVERLRDVAGVMAQFASELLGVSPRGVWEDARRRAGALDAPP